MCARGINASPSVVKLRFFEGLGTRELEAIRLAAMERRYPASSVITNQGRPADHLYLLISGRARYFYITKNGRKTLLLWLTPGEILGSAAFLSRPSEYLMSTEAIKDSSFLVWESVVIRGLAVKYPKLVENALSMGSKYLGWYLADHVALVCDTARERLAQVLIQLAGVIGQKSPEGIEFDATNEELANAANITPFTASRLLNKWQREHAVEKHRGKLLVRSPGRLLPKAV